MKLAASAACKKDPPGAACKKDAVGAACKKYAAGATCNIDAAGNASFAAPCSAAPESIASYYDAVSILE